MLPVFLAISKYINENVNITLRNKLIIIDMLIVFLINKPQVIYYIIQHYEKY